METISRLLISLVAPPGKQQAAWWCVLYVAGFIAWTLFFSGWDRAGFYANGDWPKQYQYYEVIRQSLSSGEIPWHTSVPLQQSQPTDRFLSIPETVFI